MAVTRLAEVPRVEITATRVFPFAGATTVTARLALVLVTVLAVADRTRVGVLGV
jgi:hypothetical protein